MDGKINTRTFLLLITHWLFYQPSETSGQLIRLGEELQINTYTYSQVRSLDVEADGSNNFVIVWSGIGSPEDDDSSSSIQARLFSSDGEFPEDQFQVNNYTTNFQREPAVAAADDGSFVVSWHSVRFGWSVHARRFEADGSPDGDQFQVSISQGSQTDGAVASASDGDFVAVWTGVGGAGPDTSGASIQGQKFDTDGMPIGNEFTVNTYTTGTQRRPAVAMAPNRRFLVAWENDPGTITESVRTQVHEFDGMEIGSEFQANIVTSGYHEAVDVAGSEDGFVVVWEKFELNETGPVTYSVHGRLFGPDGTPNGPEIQVNSSTVGTGPDPAVAMAADGTFVVIWRSSSQSIKCRVFDPQGMGGDEFQVNSTGGSHPRVAIAPSGKVLTVWERHLGNVRGQLFRLQGMGQVTPEGSEEEVGPGNRPAIASDNSGNFEVVVETLATGDFDIYAHGFDPTGKPGPKFPINTFTNFDQTAPDVTFIQDGRFVVVWNSYAQDGSGHGVFGQLANSGGTQGAEFQINTYSTGEQFFPKVAGSPPTSGAAAGPDDFDFVVVWESENVPMGDGFDIVGRAFLGEQPLGPEFLINIYTTGDQRAPTVALDPAGNFDFLVAWEGKGEHDDQGIFGQLVHLGAKPYGIEFQVNTTAVAHQAAPAVEYQPSGEFLVVWEGETPDGVGIFGQHFTPQAEPIGNEFQISTYPTSRQSRPTITLDPSGDFTVIWDSDEDQDGDGKGIFGQLVASEGNPSEELLGFEFQVNTGTLGDQASPAVAPSPVGGAGFVTVWESEPGTGNSQVFFQRFKVATVFGEDFEAGDASGWSAVSGLQ